MLLSHAMWLLMAVAAAAPVANEASKDAGLAVKGDCKRDGGESSTCGGGGWFGYDQAASEENKVTGKRAVDEAGGMNLDCKRDGGESSTCGGGGWFGYDQAASEENKVTGKRGAEVAYGMEH